MKKQYTNEQSLLFEQLGFIAEGLAKTLAPFCEVVVHDLLDPESGIVSIHNNLSGRAVGAPVTELGLARISNPEYPQVLANYANKFADGRMVKSTSVGIKDSTGKYVAALCLNIDLSMLQGLKSVLERFTNLELDASFAPKETLDPKGVQSLRERIDVFAAKACSTPRSLKKDQKQSLIRELRDSGWLNAKYAMETVAEHLGISRATAYNYLKK